jgi:REP-associated tyrosine transposase
MEPARLRGWDYRSRGWYFVTICTQNRVSVFGEVVNGLVKLSALGLIADAELKTLRTHYVNVEPDAFVVMPNHVHALIIIDGDHCFTPSPPSLTSSGVAPGFTSPRAGSLSAIVRSYKAGVTRKSRELGFKQTVWQSSFHDHVLRGDAAIAAVRDYIHNNPRNWAEDKEDQP